MEIVKTSFKGKVAKWLGCEGFILLAFVLVVAIITAAQFNKEKYVTATIYSITTQQNVSGGGDAGVSTSYTYLVGTDKGTMEIKPDGIMSSTVFGRLKEGNTYRLHTRGYSIPLLGLYPYIVDAKEVSL